MGMAFLAMAAMRGRKASSKPQPPPEPPAPKFPKTNPNAPCPCGRKHEDGKPYKFKRCCGSVIGDLHYFVADVNSDEPLMNDKEAVLVFRDHPTAAAAAKAKGWLGDKKRDVQVIPMNKDRWEHFRKTIPHVLVTAKEFNVSELSDSIRALAEAYLDSMRSPDPDSEYQKSLRVLVDACAKENRDHHAVCRQILDERRSHADTTSTQA